MQGRTPRTLLTTAVALGLLAVTPAAEAVRVSPGSFTGYAFDQCQAPSQAAMDTWRERSPYAGVGVYIAGDNRFCQWERPADYQGPPGLPNPNLTPAWVSAQSRKGWRILPITVGRQASCWDDGNATTTYISPSPANSYAAAKAQGRAEAVSTIKASEYFGFPKKTTHWLDIEHFDVTNDDCRRSMLGFVSGWTGKLHQLGYRSGFYSSGSSGITAIEGARTLSPGSYNLPDQIWIADWNGKVTVRSPWVAKDAWVGQRMHQYRGSHVETHGGVAIEIDSNWLEVGGGTKAPRVRKHCRGVRVDFPTYGVQRRGSSGDRVRALQCLLREKRLLSGDLTERYDRRVVKAVKRFQDRVGLRQSGVTRKATWVALLSSGPSPLVKVGSGSDAVRRVQRAVNAATTARLAVTGVYDRATERAVKAYQGGLGVPRTGVVATTLWASLHSGDL